MDKISKSLVLGTSVLALSACASGVVDDSADPYQSFNRPMFEFNNGVDEAVIEPVARGYRAVTNKPVRKSVSNFTRNLGEPSTFANEVLQGKLGGASGTALRFVVNTTVGIVGFFDPATSMGLPRKKEDFGQTLGTWGMASGPYLVMPLLGSTNPRDLVGTGVDMVFNPLNYAQFDGDTATRIGTGAMGGISAREGALETVDDMRDTRLDPYTTLRRFYVRDRAAKIGNREFAPNDIQEIPDYELDF